MSKSEMAEVAQLNRNAQVLGRLSYELAGAGKTEAARAVRALRCAQYARIRAITS